MSLSSQVDLHEWIHPLNVFDSALTWILKNYSHNLLLLPPFVEHRARADAAKISAAAVCVVIQAFSTATCLEHL